MKGKQMKIERVITVEPNVNMVSYYNSNKTYKTGYKITMGLKEGIGYNNNPIVALYRAYKNLRPIVTEADMCNVFCSLPDKIQVKGKTIQDELAYVDNQIQFGVIKHDNRVYKPYKVYSTPTPPKDAIKILKRIDLETESMMGTGIASTYDKAFELAILNLQETGEYYFRNFPNSINKYLEKTLFKEYKIGRLDDFIKVNLATKDYLEGKS
jgi:hypothetical protein